VSTGTPMVEAIASLERQLPPGDWRSTVEDIRSRIEQGAGLSAALEHHPRYFDAVSRSLIAAGESGGQLDEMLRRLSTLIRQQIKVRSAIVGAMVYPCLLITVCIGVLTTMMLFVLPRFEGLFETLHTPLPTTTLIIVEISRFMRAWWWAILLAIVPALVGTKLWLAGAAGGSWLDALLVRLPQFGKLFRAFATARVCRVLGVLVDGKVNLLDALALARESTGNVCYERLLARAEQMVTRGENLSAALAGTPLISDTVVEAVRSGERSGQLGPVLLSLAEFMDEDNEIILRSLSSILEPLILIVLGCLIGFVAVSMFLPLFDLATATGPGGHG
ncbi:MAG: type II secretion system F family protein, partial [Phycisphaerales bacterium]|nr:type II secretion system F family protein [Phycisphaerales bacterium]